ncbi:MAG: hypothetical protein Q4A01_05085 [Coriobacteriales bacterium]|nr:hypothetical protein [Coriobacteriales bacterium]
MATSSLIDNIRINNPKVMEEYAAAMEVAEREPIAPLAKPTTARRITDPAEMKEIMLRGIKNWGGK